MKLWLGRLSLLAAVAALVPSVARAQNTTPGTAVHLLVGQSPMVVNLATGSSTRWYDAPVVPDRSYCAEATASESEVNPTDPVLTVYRSDASTVVGVNDNTTLEPKGQTAARVCFVAPAANALVFVKIEPVSAAFENRNYTLRFVETTLWSNWFFVGGDYSSFTLLRNTTNLPIAVDLRWKNAGGAVVGSSLAQVIAANGVLVLDARPALGCALPTPCATIYGSVEAAHAASPEAVVGSQTTLSSSTGLSFDTIFFQRKAW